MRAFFHERAILATLAALQRYCERSLSLRDFHTIWRRMPSVSSASEAERWRRWTSRRILSSVGAAGGPFCAAPGEFIKPLAGRGAGKGVGCRPEAAAVGGGR